jgi:hypothetical protein
MPKLSLLLLSGALLTACQSNPPTTQDEAVQKEAVVLPDSAAAKPDSMVALP